MKNFKKLYNYGEKYAVIEITGGGHMEFKKKLILSLGIPLILVVVTTAIIQQFETTLWRT